MSKSVEKAREHVRRKGHQLSHHDGPRPWSAVVIFCKDCGRKWSVLRSEAQHVQGLVIDLNATPTEFPTAWERIDDDEFIADE